MSLDVYLYVEVDTGSKNLTETELYWANITHNLTGMAEEAGIYEALWSPEEIGAKFASDIVPLLEHGLKKLKEDPASYQSFNAPNGWGTYEHFVPFVQQYLDACREHPKAKIRTCR